jgi:hypothetical protein
MIHRLNLIPALTPEDLADLDAEIFAHELQEEWAVWDRKRREGWPETTFRLCARFSDAFFASTGFPCFGPAPSKETLEILGLLP